MEDFKRIIDKNELLLSDPKNTSNFRFDLYQHERTGLRVIFINAPGPASHSTIVVPTLCQDNYGLPHTLEHLIFCGSQNYPTRGYLEALATRSLSTGTNAWTDSDHTAYTLSTVGFEGLINTVPVFLDHVINPLLLEKDFTTEVYHFDGKARQQGVVFSEMVSRENSESDLMNINLRKILYQDQTTYSYECGGLTPFISQLQNTNIKEYHSKYYRLEFTTIILAGQDLPHDLILIALADGPTITKAPDASGIKPPNMQFPPPLELHETKVVEFPSDDDTSGSVGYAWRGPRFDDFISRLALELLLYCLTDSPASPLNQECVAIERPLANSVMYDVALSPETSLWIEFTGVPKGSNDGEPDEDNRALLEPGNFRNEFLRALTKSIDELSMELIQEGIARYRVMLLESLEDDAAYDLTQSLVPAIVADMFASVHVKDSINHLCAQFSELNELAERPLAYWKNLAHHWLLRLSPAEVVAVPNCQLGNRLELARAASQATLAAKLGQEKLTAIQASLDTIIKENKISISDEVQASLPALPKISSIPKLEAITHSLPGASLVGRAQVVEIDTRFKHVFFGLPTWCIPEELEPFFVLFQSLLFQLDLKDPELGHVDYCEVVRITNKLTVERFSHLGLENSTFTTSWLPELYFVGAKAEPSLWPKALDWVVRNVMFCRFTAERVISVARNLLTELEEFTRDGASLAWAIKSRMLKEGQSYDTRLDSSISIFRQEEFLTDVIIGLSKPATATQILAQLEGLRDILVLSAPNEGILQLGVPLRSYKDPVVCLQEFDGCWKKWLGRFKPHGPLSSSVPRQSCGIAKRAPYAFPKDISYHPCLNLAVGSLTSSYIVSVAPCDVFTAGNDPNPQDHVSKMAVLVMSELLSRCNGPLFELIRGQGLAYHVDLYLNVWAGALVFELHDSVDPTAALIAFWGFLSQLMEPQHWNDTITKLELQLAKSSLLYISTRIVGSPSSLLSSSFKYSLWGFKSGDSYVDHYREYLERVTLSDLKAVFLKYFCQFLDPSKTQIIMLTPDPTAISQDCSSDTEGDSSMTDDETIDSANHEDYKPLAALADNAYGFSFQDGSMEMF